MKSIFIISVFFLLNNMNAQTIRVPETRRGNHFDTYHGVMVRDPYRWLEDDTSLETREWVKQQNRATSDYLENIPYRGELRKRLDELSNFPRYSSPIRCGKYFLYYKNDGLQNQSVLYIREGLQGQPKVFVDPNTWSKGGTVSVNIAGVSNNDQYIAMTLNRAGSDWQEIFVMEIKSGKVLTDTLKWVKFSGAAWAGNGFYYSRYDAPMKGTEFSSQNKNHKIYYHYMGTPQSKDILIYSDPSHPYRYHGASVTEDERFLIISSSEGTYGTELRYKNLKLPNSPVKLLIQGFSSEYEVIDNIGDKLVILTDHKAANRKIVLVNPAMPDMKNWKTLVAENKDLIERVVTGGGKMYIHYLKDCSTRIYACSPDGKNPKEIRLPGLGTAYGFSGKKEDTLLFYNYTSFIVPSTIYQFNTVSGESVELNTPELKFNQDLYEVRQVFYPSKDKTLIPMFLVHKKNLELDGYRPALLYGYGGFNVNITPTFSASRIAFLEQGGVYAVANLRGGGEYGDAWHKAGMLANKQNVFDDFIAAAQYLIAEKYTNSSRLAIMGGSNGGLLVGACMTQHPDLFAVAIPQVGVLDMLRYQKFTAGVGWVVEYGSSDKKEQFDYLYKYSPLHSIKPGITYPATLVITADHDDRVVPAHSFKFISMLQFYNNSERPRLIRIETDAGHGAGKPLSKALDEMADIYSFTLWNMGITQLNK